MDQLFKVLITWALVTLVQLVAAVLLAKNPAMANSYVWNAVLALGSLSVAFVTFRVSEGGILRLGLAIAAGLFTLFTAIAGALIILRPD